MKCDNCGKEMKEEIIFTSISYSCKCFDAGWQSAEDLLELLSPMDLPIKLKFEDEDGKSGSVFIGELTYFSRCPKGRKFKIIGICDPYSVLVKGTTELDVAEQIFGYSIVNEDDGS